jgi:DNA-binding transcriptional LysR family regulator
MTSEQIQIFIAVCRHLNFTKVAEEFHTTQPTISRQINSLEEEWGFYLFIRNKKEVRLTPEGSLMYVRCMEMERRLKDSLQEAKALSSGTKGHLNLGFLADFDEDDIILPYVEGFARQYPFVRINVQKRSFADLRRMLSTGEFDIIFTLDFEKSGLGNVQIDVWEKLDSIFLISDKHPLYNKENLTVEDFNHITFVITSSLDSPDREYELKEIFKKLGLDNTIIPAPNLDSALLEVRLGRAATIHGTNGYHSRPEKFRCIPIPKEIVNLNMITACSRENLNPTIPLFLEFLHTKTFH